MKLQQNKTKVHAKQICLAEAAVVVLTLAGIYPVLADHSKAEQKLIVPAEFGNNTVTTWYPALEWTIKNVRCKGNPFDLVAKVRFIHESGKETRTTEMFYDGNHSWKFRFTGTRAGRWRFTTHANGKGGTSKAGRLDGRKGKITVKPNPDQEAVGFMSNTGQKWRWQGSGTAFVPQLLMIESNSGANPKHYLNPSVVDSLIDTFLAAHGFTGFHTNRLAGFWFDIDAETRVTGSMKNPDPQTFEALELLITRTHREGCLVHIWAWGDGKTPNSRAETPHLLRGGINGVEDRRLQRYIAARLGPLPGWSMGYGFDLDEWTNAGDLDSWNRFMQSHMGWHHFLGGRPAGPNGGTDHSRYKKWNRGLEYSSYEHHKPDYEVYAGALKQLKKQPAFSEDRNRVRSRRKDFSELETRRGLWQSTMAGGVANIWGQLTTKEKAAGTGVYKNREQLKTYSTFWFEKGRFLLDMERANRLSKDNLKPKPNDVNNDTNTRVLKASPNQLVFYRQNADTIHMDLSGMSGPQPAVAVDTARKYSELDIGPLKPGEHTWKCPHRSDWAVAVGRFPHQGK